jgi:hypothetical protein
MRRSLKFIHTVSTAVLVGTLVLQLVIAFRYNALLAADDATALGARAVLVEVTRWVMGPSLVVCVVSGLLLMGLNRTFASAGWVWAKALLGLMLVKGVITIQDPAVHELYALAVQGIAGKAEALAELARLARMEWLGGWLALVLAVAAIAFGVWRPRFGAAEQAPRGVRAARGAGDDRADGLADDAADNAAAAEAANDAAAQPAAARLQEVHPARGARAVVAPERAGV